MSVIGKLLPIVINRGTHSVIGGANEHGGNDFNGTVTANTSTTDFQARTLQVEGDSVVLVTLKDTDASPDTGLSFIPSDKGGKEGFVRVENGGGIASLVEIDIPVGDLAAAETAYHQANPSGPLTQITFGQSLHHGYEFKFGE